MEELDIIPFKSSCIIDATVPGSKSITNRAMILAAMRNGDTLLNGALFSEDTEIMIDCLIKLGFAVAYNKEASWIKIKGADGSIPEKNASLYVGNAGTAARFLTAFLALQDGGSYKIDGCEAMRKRPMSGLIDALTQLGVSFEFLEEEKHFPFVMKTTGIKKNNVSVDASASSQILSALLQIAPVIARKNNIPFSVELLGETVSHPFVKMTLFMIEQFGWKIPEFLQSPYVFDGCTLDVELKTSVSIPPVFEYKIEPDASAASYFLMLPFVVGGSIKVKDLTLNGLQGDALFLDTLEKENLLAGKPEDDGVLSQAGTSRKGVNINFNAISDTFLTLAAITPLLDSPTTISGIEHTRKQETDRIAAMANELSKIVGEENVSQTNDSLSVIPISLDALRKRVSMLPSKRIRIKTYHDHRVAMSFAILGCFDLFGDGTPWVIIEDPRCTSKTFPKFFDELNKIRSQANAS